MGSGQRRRVVVPCAEGALSPLHRLAYRCRWVKGGGSNSARIVGGWQKRLYIFAGFVDYPKAELGRVVRRRPMGAHASPGMSRKCPRKTWRRRQRGDRAALAIGRRPQVVSGKDKWENSFGAGWISGGELVGIFARLGQEAYYSLVGEMTAPVRAGAAVGGVSKPREQGSRRGRSSAAYLKGGKTFSAGQGRTAR